MREGACLILFCDFVFAVFLGRCDFCHDDEQHTSACMHDDCGG